MCMAGMGRLKSNTHECQMSRTTNIITTHSYVNSYYRAHFRRQSECERPLVVDVKSATVKTVATVAVPMALIYTKN